MDAPALGGVRAHAWFRGRARGFPSHGYVQVYVPVYVPVYFRIIIWYYKLDYNILVYIQGTVQAVSDSSLTFLNILSPIIFPGTVFVELRPWGFSYVQWAGTLEENRKTG